MRRALLSRAAGHCGLALCLALQPAARVDAREGDLESSARAVELGDARRLVWLRDYAQAETAIRQVLATHETRSTQHSLEAAEALDLLAEVLWRSGRARDKEALEVASAAVEIKLDHLRPTDRRLTVSLINVAEIQRSLGALDQAESLLLEAESLLKLGPSGATGGQALVGVLLATVWTEKAAFDKAEGALTRALDRLGRDSTADPLDLAFATTRLAILQRKTGRDAAAEASFNSAREIYQTIERDLGRPDPDSANVLVSQAILWDEQGNFSRAARAYEQAIEIWQPLYGSDSLRVAIAHHNLGLLLRQIGDYRAATDRFFSARQTFQRLYGANHPYSLSALQTEGELAMLLGDLSTSRTRLERVLAARRVVLPTNAPEIGTAHHRLGELALRSGALAEAEKHFSRAREIFTESLGSDHPDLAQPFLGLGRIALARGDGLAATVSFEAADDLEVGANRRHSASHLDALHGLAKSALLRGDPAQAGRLLSEVYEQRRLTLTDDHPVLVETLTDLARGLLAGGESGRAFDLALEAEDLARRHLTRTIPALPEKQVLDYSRSRITPIGLALEIASAGEMGAERIALLYARLVALRGVGLSEMIRRQELDRAAQSPSTRLLLGELTALSQRLSNLSRLTADQIDARAYRVVFENWERVSAELALRRQSSGGLARPAVPFDPREFLTPGTALVSYARFEVASRRTTASPDGDDGAEYSAFVVAGSSRAVLVSLGSAEEIEQTTRDWREDVRRADSYCCAGPGAHRLRRLVWDPIETQTGGAESILVVPDGVLAEVSLAALPARDGGYLLEHGPLFHYLERERDLVSRVKTGPVPASLLAVGAPTFDRGFDSDLWQGEAAPSGGSSSVSRGHYFLPLPRSATEVRAASRSWDLLTGGHSRVLVGGEATEGAFRRLAGLHGVVHLATHALAPERLEDPRLEGRFEFGLAFAGANQPTSSGSPDDGLLTAAEITAMDLSQVGLLVLSACDSGRGPFARNEGILGLRRAFRIAGVRSQVVTLWPIQDEDAEAWARGFYETLPGVGFNVALAVREASRSLLAQGRGLDAWAPFVSVGDIVVSLQSNTPAVLRGERSP